MQIIFFKKINVNRRDILFKLILTWTEVIKYIKDDMQKTKIIKILFISKIIFLTFSS